MHTSARWLAAAWLGWGMLAPASAATLNITFAQPERYTDAAYRSALSTEKERAAVQRDIAQHLRQLTEKTLPADHALSIEVLDIDLAGHFEPFHFRDGSDVRIVREVTWPRITLRYRLSRGGQTLGSAEEQLADLNFLASINRYASGDRLRYEKSMLDDWFVRRFTTR
ncbi:MAG TPA: DUF3016 domain-containing protein [Burkholderiaceae bacterium]